jgi:hypothetical protein
MLELLHPLLSVRAVNIIAGTSRANVQDDQRYVLLKSVWFLTVIR